MASCNIRMRRLDNEEGRGEENRSLRGEMFKNDNANIVDGKTNKQVGAGKSRSRKGVTRDSKGKKNEILWTHHEKGRRDHAWKRRSSKARFREVGEGEDRGSTGWTIWTRRTQEDLIRMTEGLRTEQNSIEN